MPYRLAVPALVVLLLAVFPAGAQAGAWEISYQPENPVAGEVVTFTAERLNPGNPSGESLVWDFGDGSSGSTAEATHTYGAGGDFPVTLSTHESDGTETLEDSAVVHVEPPPNTAPSAAFTFSPTAPLVGESVLFTGGSDADGDPITRAWDFGDFTPPSSEVSPNHAYATAGSYTVTLSVTDDRGGFASTSQSVTVSPQPDALPQGTTPPAVNLADDVAGSHPKTVLVRMKPFPVVRIAGVVLPTGAAVRILSVRAPLGARTLVKCSGRGCPARSMARTSATRVVRFRRFERSLRAGITLELFVRKGARIGKYTRFRIRAGKPPARVDGCLAPGSNRPVRCP